VFWNWDQQSADAINRWARRAPGGHVAVVGGDPWRELWQQEAGELVRTSQELVERRKRGIGGEHHNQVTLSSQGDAVPHAVLEAMRASPPGWRYWVRLHQVNQAARRAEATRVLGPLGVDLELMEFATEAPLPALLRALDAHLTVSLSTVISEAAAFGLGSVACGGEAAAFFRQESAAGMLVVAQTPGEILSGLGSFLAAGRRAVEPSPARAFELLRRLLEGRIAPPGALAAGAPA
jgi:hypothetical protein